MTSFLFVLALMLFKSCACHGRENQTNGDWTESGHRNQTRGMALICSNTEKNMCNQTHGMCIWSETRRVCYMKGHRKKHEESKSKGERKDLCSSLNATTCFNRPGKCAWSYDTSMCFLKHKGLKQKHSEGKGQSQDSCSSLNEVACFDRPGKCAWSSETSMCFLKRKGLTHEHFEGKGGRKNACRSLDEATCHDRPGKCTWSSGRSICHERRKSLTHKQFGSTGEWTHVCSSLDEAACSDSEGKCTWSPGGDHLSGFCNNMTSQTSIVGIFKDGSIQEDGTGLDSTVEFTLRISHLDYASLSAKQNGQTLIVFTNVLKASISTQAGSRIAPEHVDLILAAGSVVVEVSIKPPTGILASSLQSSILENHQHMSTDIAARLEKVAGIAAVRVSAGSIGVSMIREPAVRLGGPVATGSPAVNAEPSGEKHSAGILAVLIIAVACACPVALLGLVACACYKGRHTSSIHKNSENVVQGCVMTSAVAGTMKPTIMEAFPSSVVVGVVVDNDNAV